MISNDQRAGGATERPRIACVGEAMVELSGLDLAAGRAAVVVAGDTLNTAIYLKRALPGAEVAYVTALGDDPLSDGMVAAMAAEGLDTSLVARLPGRLPGLYAIATDARGERSFAYWRRDAAARAMFGPRGVDMAALEGLDALYFTGITLAILPPLDRVRLTATAARMKAARRVVAFDSNHRPRLWEDEDAARAAYAAMWRAATIALPSRDDEARLHPGEGVEAVFARLAVPEAALKDGAAGPHLWAGEPLPRGEFPPAPRVVDTTAAGDGFNAGYLAARLRGEGPEAAARAGHALAARIVGHPGAIMPRDD